MQYRRIISAALLISFLIISLTGCRLIGNLFGLGFGSDDHFYGMTKANGTLYLSSLPHNSVVDIDGEELFATFEKPHGLEFDGTNFWVADPNGNKIHQYGNTGNRLKDFDLGADPVNMLHATVNGTDRLFVADREENNILSYEMDENGDIVQDEAEASGEVSSIIKIYLDEFLNSKAIGTIDMAYNGADTLYVVSDEYDGLMEVDLSSGTLNGVTGVTYAKKTGDFGGLGVALDENELIYINTGNRILTFDGNDWVDLGIDLREDGGHDYNGYYTDLVITDIDYTSSDAESSSSQHLYVASGLSPEEEVDDEVPHHVIIYSNEGGDWTYYKTVNFDF